MAAGGVPQGVVADPPDERPPSRRDLHRASRRDPVGGTRRPTRRWPWVLIAVVGVAAAGAAWLLVDLRTARSQLLQAARHVAFLKADVLAGDAAAAAASLDALQGHAEAAREATHGPHWSLGARLPWVGPNVSAVHTVAEVIADLADGPVPTLLDATALVDPGALAPVEGRVDLAPLRAAEPAVVAADAAVRDAAARLAAIDRSTLWPVVDTAFGDAVAEVEDLRSSTATASRAVRLLPPMLGADGPRRYLLLVQNSAEVRATGGIPGAVLLLTADDGALAFAEHRSGGSLGDLPAPVVELTDAERALFGEDLAADMRDVGFTPDFPRAAEIARQVWREHVGGEVDGVAAVDPGALALVLRATGPVPLEPGPVADAAGGRLTSDNAVQVLLSTVYTALADPAQQDEFFATTAASVFDALLGAGADPATLVDSLAEATRQGRLLVWSAHEEEQDLLAGTVLAGELRGHAGESPVVGVYLNDGSRAKMSYYLETSVEVGRPECLPDGDRRVAVSVTLRNAAPPDAATALPPYVTGGGAVVPVGEVRTNVLLYAPAGGTVEGVEVVGAVPGVASQVHDGLMVVGKTTQLAPGAEVRIEATVTTGAERRGPVLVRTSPARLLDVTREIEDRCP